MRRTPTPTDQRETTAAAGAATSDFDTAYDRLVEAWRAHATLRGRPDQVAALARASQRLDEARLHMAFHRTV